MPMTFQKEIAMNDRELLELAAKAIQLKHVDYSGVDYDGSQGLVRLGEHGRHGETWNPLEDDGDAFRLAVKLGMGVNFSQYDAFTNVYPEGFNHRANTISERTSDISRLAEISRRAIVRAAAEIAKATA